MAALVSLPLVYLHCALRAPRRPVVRGRWPRMPGGEPPRALAIGGDLWAIVSSVPEATYGEEGLAAGLADVDWLSACGGAHHAVIARARGSRSVVPFRLLTLFRSEARVVDELARLRGPVGRALDRVSDRDEWVVRAIAGRATAAAPARRPTTGTAYLLARAAPSSRPAAATRRDVRAMAADVTRHAAAVVRRRPGAGQADVLYDAALLVPRRRRAALRSTVGRWTSRLASSGCRLSVTGPWPPYSFVSLPGRAHRTRAGG